MVRRTGTLLGHQIACTGLALWDGIATDKTEKAKTI